MLLPCVLHQLTKQSVVEERDRDNIHHRRGESTKLINVVIWESRLFTQAACRVGLRHQAESLNGWIGDYVASIRIWLVRRSKSANLCSVSAFSRFAFHLYLWRCGEYNGIIAITEPLTLFLLFSSLHAKWTISRKHSPLRALHQHMNRQIQVMNPPSRRKLKMLRLWKPQKPPA